MTALRRTQLIRFGAWTGLATLAVLVALVAARTETGVRRIATLSRPSRPAARAQREGPAARQPHPRPGGRAAAPQRGHPHARRRSRPPARAGHDARAQLRGRDRLDRPTGREGATRKPRRCRRRSLLLRRPRRRKTASRPATWRPVPRLRRTASRQRPSSASTSARTPRSRDCARSGRAVKANQPGLLEGLRPLIALREGQKGGSPELRLVAGPLANASVAARLCAALAHRRPGLPAGRVRRAAAGAAVTTDRSAACARLSSTRRQIRYLSARGGAPASREAASAPAPRPPR